MPMFGGDVLIHDLWYKNAIVYCLDVARFQDGNGDGYGDFIGLMERLDYLVGLGVDTLWLMPCFPSPKQDDGYDVVDYFDVDRRLGTLGDFVEFLHRAQVRGLRVILDLVVNHTSDQHPWFHAARRGEQPFRDYYYWAEQPPASAADGVAFPGDQATTWTWDDRAGAHYYHQFREFQPDLRTDNPKVQHEIQKIVGFWLQLGISGFRVDAVPSLIESMDKPSNAQPRFEFLRNLRQFLQWRSGRSVLLAEANVPPDAAPEYFGRSHERLHMLFNFPLNQSLFYALATSELEPLKDALERTRLDGADAQYAVFLRNHDELNLGALSQAQRRRVFEVMGPDPDVQLYGRGLRRRLAPLLDGDPRRIQLALALLFGLPGTPVLYYGDELGLGDDLSQPDRLAVRTGMQWSADRHGGFTTAEHSHVPVISDGPYAYDKVNVARQNRDPSSLLNVSERMIRMRKECPEIGFGQYQVLDTPEPQVLALRFRHDGRSVLTLYNFSEKPAVVPLAPAGPQSQPVTNLLEAKDPPRDHSGRHVFELDGYGYGWYRLGTDRVADSGA